jgi:hypothetical protein
MAHVVTPEEARAIINSGLATYELKLVTSFATPLYWAIRKEGRSIGARNGTAFFLDAGHKPFGVTACHVIDGWKRSRAEQDGGPLRLGGQGTSLPMDWDERAIDANSEIDIATFSITATEVRSLGKTIMTGVQREWPPTPPIVNGGLYFCGFPGVGTIQLSNEAVSFGAFPGSGIAASVSDRDVSILLEREYMVPLLGGGIPPENFDFGGMSGGPVIKIVETPIRSWALAGVIYRGPNISVDPDQAIEGFKLISARRSHFILPDGRLDMTQWRSLSL